MPSGSNLRKAGMAIAGGGVYAFACLLAYSAFSNPQDDDGDERQGNNCCCCSNIDNPQRSRQFQNIANRYDKDISWDERMMGINLLRRSLLYFHASGTVLEVGAGTGRNLGYYPSSTVDRVLLTDASDKMLAEARKKIQKIAKTKPKFACLEGNVTDLSFPDASFDCVVDTFGLCSYDDPISALNEMARMCKPNGRVLLLEHGRSKTWSFITDYLDRHANRHAKKWGCVWNRDLDDMLERADLQVDRLSTWHFGTTYYIVCTPKHNATAKTEDQDTVKSENQDS